VSTEEVFRRVIGALDQAGIPYMLTGSFASGYHSSPRATQDIDLVIAPTSEQVRKLASLLPASDFYFDEEAALSALRRQRQFNVIDLASGWKVDLIVRKSRPFSVLEFERRREADFLGLRMVIASAEDVLLAKLEWSKQGGSLRQIEDAAGILRIREDRLDLEYILNWVRELGLGEQWAAACRMAGARPESR